MTEEMNATPTFEQLVNSLLTKLNTTLVLKEKPVCH